MGFFTQGIEFEDIRSILKIYKKQQRTLAEVLSFFSQEVNRNQVSAIYEQVAPLTVKEAISLSNSEQRAVALKNFSIEEIVESLKAVLVDKQTVKKSHIRWDENLKPYKHEFEDTYELYRIEAETLGIRSRWAWQSDFEVYFVKCNCTSTNRQYYLYVPQYIGMQKDAIEAIAWTMRFGNQPLTKQQYLNLMYSET